MKSFDTILQIVNSFHELSETINAAEFLLEEYNFRHPNFKGFELREKAEPKFILMTTEGTFGQSQIIKIPENTFEFPLVLMLNLIAHEMVHVGQKTIENKIEDRNEREWQAYYEMNFHKIYPQIPELSNYYKKFFANKGLEYYTRMGENNELQLKYASQKKEIDELIASLS